MLEGVPGMDATRRAILEHHEHFDGADTKFDPEVARLIVEVAPPH